MGLDDPLLLVAVVVLLLLVVVGVVLKKKRDAAEDDDDDEEERPRASARKKNGAKGKSAGGKGGKRSVAPSASAAREQAKREPSKSKKEKEEEVATHTATESDEVETGEVDEGDWGWSSAPAVSTTVDDTKVSVQNVDALTEFNVYKQFGYTEKAAESLTAYLKKFPDKADIRLVGELLDLWLEAKKIDETAEALTEYQNLFNSEQIAEYIKKGLAIDGNHLGLRVLAEARLGWTVKQTAQEIGEQTEVAPATASEQQPSDNKKSAAKGDGKPARKSLVVGTPAPARISNEEKSAVLAFMPPEQSVKLLKGVLSYETAIRHLNRAIRASARPAAFLIDALTMDFKAKNLPNFASHLWSLYYSLGQGGRQVKERMLGLGYSLGEHPLFGALESNPTDAAVLREIGIQQGFMEMSAGAKKSRHKALVTETTDFDSEPKTPAERVLKEAEFLLMYGQLEHSMDMLENAIKDYPQESQLYITLFDLYERAEEWDRLKNLLNDLRTQFQSLPEEVVLAMSQLLQRFNNGSFGR